MSEAVDLEADLFNLAMSEEAQPLMDAVQKHIRDNVEPIQEEFARLHAEKEDRWSWHPRQLELLDGAKEKAKAAGLWNFFLPDSEIGEGLTNLDYAYIAAELGKYPLASETLNCSAPDTGNMEVLERVGTEAQKEQWLKPLLNGEIRSALRHDGARPAVVGCQEHQHPGKAGRRRVGHQRREVLHLRRRRSTLQDHDHHGEDQSGRAAFASPAVPDSGAHRHTRRRDHSKACRCSGRTTRRAATCTSSSTTCACRRRTSCSAKGEGSRSPRSDSGPDGSTTACARSARPRRRWS